MSTPKSASRVFVTQENANLNYTPAEAFGEVVFLTRDEVSPVANSLINDGIRREIQSKLANFNPELDFIAPSGSPVVCGMAFAQIGQLFAGRKVCVLRWSNRDRVYQPIQIEL